MELLQKIFKGDRIVWIVYAILCFISLIEVFSATSTLAYSTQNPFGPIARHASFLIMGTVGVIFFTQFPLQIYKGIGCHSPVSGSDIVNTDATHWCPRQQRISLD